MSEIQSQSPAPRTSRSRGMAVILALALALILCAVVVYFRTNTYHLATVQEGVLYRDGFKSASQFTTAIDKVHPRTVVSLIDAKELADPNKPQFAKEAEVCAMHGAKLVRIPVTLGGWPSSDDIRQFLAIVSDKQNQPVLIHCAQGVRRTGMFVAAYQESVLGYDKTKASEAIVSFGHSGNTIDDIKRFIDQYDAKNQTAPGDLGHGSE